MNQQKPILLTVAPNGARKTKLDHPNIPLNTEELALTAKDCLAAGASMIHLHVRNEDGSHSLSVDHYAKAIAAIRQATDDGIFIQVTSEAVGIYTAEEQFEMIHTLKPDAVSIGLREIKSLTNEEIYQHFLAMRALNIFPQIILYSESDLDLYKDWLENDIIPGNAYPLLIVIGKEMDEPGFTNEHLKPVLINNLQASSWMICAFGENEYEAGKLAANLGGHVRIGFENNSTLVNGTIAKNNADLISQMAAHLESKSFPRANLSQTRQIMKPDW